jgi:hypothetical protein
MVKSSKMLRFAPSCYCVALYKYEKKEKGTVALTRRKGRLDIVQDILGFTGAAGAVKSFSRAKHVHSRRQPVHFGQRPFTPPRSAAKGVGGGYRLNRCAAFDSVFSFRANGAFFVFSLLFYLLPRNYILIYLRIDIIPTA